MYKAILFDLDGTLVENDMRKFIAAYFQSLGPKIAAFCPNGDYEKAIYSATRPLFKKQRTPVPLIDIFYRELSVFTGLPVKELDSIFQSYYKNDYPKIKVVKPISGALECVKLASELAEKLVVATVPIFPVNAIKARLRQGKITGIKFDLITGVEVMHSSKPHPYYFQEILEKINCLPQECLMIGNDHSDDMAAKAVGIDTYLVTLYQMNRGKSRFTPDHTGTLDDLNRFLRELS